MFFGLTPLLNEVLKEHKFKLTGGGKFIYTNEEVSKEFLSE